MLMKRRSPSDEFRGMPCSVTALGCATGRIDLPVGLRPNGYLSLKDMDAFIRSNTAVLKKVYYPRADRVSLRDFVKQPRQTGHKKAIVCCLGHYVYLDDDTYYSFFKNGDDKVVCVWWLKEE